MPYAFNMRAVSSRGRLMHPNHFYWASWNVTVLYSVGSKALGSCAQYTGAICIALNPFDWSASEHLYAHSLLVQYRAKARGALPPHVYAVAEEAYSRMRGERRVLGGPFTCHNQSVLVSGESGSGKYGDQNRTLAALVNAS